MTPAYNCQVSFFMKENLKKILRIFGGQTQDFRDTMYFRVPVERPDRTNR